VIYNTNLLKSSYMYNSATFIETPVPSQENERSCIGG